MLRLIMTCQKYRAQQYKCTAQYCTVLYTLYFVFYFLEPELDPDHQTSSGWMSR
eukprot:m.416851 g.416851  ORF g.416851 m.416851 type:complete len:54 (+) comp30130_c0_seq1:276-437(+)